MSFSSGTLSFRAWLLCTLGAMCLLLPRTIRSAEPAASAAESSELETPYPAYLALMLARDDAIHQELRLTAKQLHQVSNAVERFDHPLWILRDVPVVDCQDQLDEHLQALRTDLAAALQPAQMARFEQLLMQARGAKALLFDDVAQRLQLSSRQLVQLKDLVSQAEGKTLDGRQVAPVLSSTQQAELARLFGPRFDLSRVTYVGCHAPELRSVDTWINSPPLSLESLRGRVVVVHFWAFGCINCIRNLPHYQSWYESFPQSDLTIIGIHTPETEAERSAENLAAKTRERNIRYPVAFDAQAENWRAWGNHMWPSVYIIDRRGRVRAWWYGELNWEGAKGEEAARATIAQLLAEKPR